MNNKLNTLLRREIWEHRIHLRTFGVWLLFLTLASLAMLIAKHSGVLPVADKYEDIIALGVGVVIPALINMSMLWIMIFLALDSLYGERKNQSFLFWKSLPVGDGLVVISKLLFILLIVPAVALVAIVFSQVVTLGLQSLLFEAPTALISDVVQRTELVDFWLGAPSFLVGQILWYFPVIGWCMLCSASSGKAHPFTPAVLSPLGVGVVSYMLGFDSVNLLLKEHVLMEPIIAAVYQAGSVSLYRYLHVDMALPLLLDNSHLWWGVLVGVVFVALAAWRRRRMETI